ncbi:MAG: hypothetical protein ACJAR9_001165 [Celeribacter sp.]
MNKLHHQCTTRDAGQTRATRGFDLWHGPIKSPQFVQGIA